MSQTIEIHLAGQTERLDKALAHAYPALSRSQWQQLIHAGQVTIEGQPVKSKDKVEARALVTAVLPDTQPTALIAQPIPLDILYEDGDLLAINKPAGLVVHPAVGHEDGTLVNGILHYCGSELRVGHEQRPGIVHRLDKETSGVILVAKQDQALTYLQEQFKERTIHKVYLALVEGVIEPTKARIDAPIGRDPRQRQRMSVIAAHRSAKARPAQTDYQLEQQFSGFSLVRCLPLTGRTHQIRVHLAYIGYPIVGDAVYGRRRQTLPLGRHFLHAAQITFRRPSDGQALTVQAPLPRELQAVLTHLEEE